MTNKLNKFQARIFFTLLTAALIVGIMLSLVSYMYNHSENEGYERLRLETNKIKNTINV